MSGKLNKFFIVFFIFIMSVAFTACSIFGKDDDNGACEGADCGLSCDSDHYLCSDGTECCTRPKLNEPCDANCATGYVCIIQEDESYVCNYFADGNCAPCSNPADCPLPGSSCLTNPEGNSYCAAPCVAEGDCASGFTCTEGNCLSTLGTCECSDTVLGQSLPCSTTNPYGTCNGLIYCLPDGNWSNCSALPAEEEICDSKDNDCDGITDEGC